MWSLPWAVAAGGDAQVQRPAWLYFGAEDDEALRDSLVDATLVRFRSFAAALETQGGLCADDAEEAACMLLLLRP